MKLSALIRSDKSDNAIELDRKHYPDIGFREIAANLLGNPESVI